ncbi:MAG: ABC transporter permease [Patescibacteria group bacterium]
MNNLSFVFKSAFFDFSRNKGRTFLTSLGILIGVLAVLLLMALGYGLRKYISNQLDSLGANLVYVMPGNKKAIAQGAGMVGGIKFDDKDIQKIKRLSGISVIVGVFAKPGAEVEAEGKSEIVEMIASTADINSIMNIEIEQGRLIEEKDCIKRQKNMVISPRVAEKLFGSIYNALGKNIYIENQGFKVIGVYKSKGGGGLGGSDMDSHVFVPAASVYSFNPDKKYYGIYLRGESKEIIPQLKKDIEEVLLRRYEEKQFSVVDQAEIMETISTIFNMINLVLVAIAGISLLVGGIGIMNIMYVTVTERIREIGIRRALGAHRTDILSQFLIESVFLSLFGGIAGLILAFVIVHFVQSVFPAYIDVVSVILSLGVSSAIGIIFGVFPAKKAADLIPIDAIRYE